MSKKIYGIIIGMLLVLFLSWGCEGLMQQVKQRPKLTGQKSIPRS